MHLHLHGLPTGKLAAVLDPEGDERLTVGRVRVGFELMSSIFNWVRERNLTPYDELVFPWPWVALHGEPE